MCILKYCQLVFEKLYLNLSTVSHFSQYYPGVIAPVHLSKALRATPCNFWYAIM